MSGHRRRSRKTHPAPIVRLSCSTEIAATPASPWGCRRGRIGRSLCSGPAGRCGWQGETASRSASGERGPAYPTAPRARSHAFAPAHSRNGNGRSGISTEFARWCCMAESFGADARRKSPPRDEVQWFAGPIHTTLPAVTTSTPLVDPASRIGSESEQAGRRRNETRETRRGGTPEVAE